MSAEYKPTADHPSWMLAELIPVASEEPIAHHLADILGRQLMLYAEASASVKAEQSNLSRTDFKALTYIAELEPLPTGYLAQLMGMSHGGVTAVINRLEEGGFIRRDRCMHDRRLVMLTVAVESSIDLTFPDHVMQSLAEVSKDFSSEQLTDIHRFLEHCIDRLRQDTRSWLAGNEQ